MLRVRCADIPGLWGHCRETLVRVCMKQQIWKLRMLPLPFLSTPFLPPRFFYFSSPFPLLVWFSSLSGAKNLSFGPFLLQVSLGSFSKNRLDVLSVKDAFHTQTSSAKLRPINNSCRFKIFFFLSKGSFHYCACKLGLIDMILVKRFIRLSRHKNIFRDFAVVKCRYILGTCYACL